MSYDKSIDYFKEHGELDYRLSKRELLEQKRELLLYVINYLCTSDDMSLEQGIQDISELTGINITLEEAQKIKQTYITKSIDTDYEQKSGLRH